MRASSSENWGRREVRPTQQGQDMVSLRAQVVGEAPDSTPEQDAVPQSEVRHIEAPRESGAPDILKPPRRGLPVLIFGSVMGAFWAGTASAYLWGYFAGQALTRIDPQLLAFAVTVILLPPLLFIAAAFALARALTLSDTARQLAAISHRLTAADEGAVQDAQRLGRAVRRELDALSSGLDGAFGRFRALETALEDRVAQLEDAGARAGVRADAIAQRLHAERDGIEDLAARLDQAATHAAEILAGRTAQLKAIIADAGGELRAAGQTLDAQVTQFHHAAETAARAPQAAAVELDRQAKEIETAGEAAAARAEFVLARQERQRVAMGELLTRLNEEAEAFEDVMQTQRNGVEIAANVLTVEAQRLEEITTAGLRRLDAAMVHASATFADQTQRLDAFTQSGLRRLDESMAQAAARSAQLAQSFGNDANRVKEVSDGAAEGIARLVETLRETATSAHALFADSTESARRRSIAFVGDAMAQCDSLLRAVAAVAEETEKARAALSRAAEDAERHIVSLPGVAQQEAQRIREAVRSETEAMLDISARAITTLQTRSGRRREPEPPIAQQNVELPAPESTSEGLRGLARRITGTRRRIESHRSEPAKGTYELSAVLAAADAGGKTGLRPGAASALAALQAALADLAGDLEELAGETADPALWRRYVDGDRGVFARRLAASIGPESVNRITDLYRENPRFHDSAETYMAEFEAMLARAREGDRDGFLASTLLTADTGKIYLAIAYALGRLE